MPEPLIILTATAFEQQALRDQLQQPISQQIGHRTFWRGILGPKPVVLIETGIGTVNTAQALTVALQHIKPDLVLQIGIGGAYLPADLSTGDLVLATEENYGDLGVLTPKGWSPADEIGIPVVSTDQDYYNTYPLNPNLVAEAQEALQDTDESVKTGPFVTVQQCTGRADLGNEIAKRFNAICENMEGVASAQICTLYNVPFLELRAISNQVEDRDKKRWDIPLALQRVQHATAKLIEALN